VDLDRLAQESAEHMLMKNNPVQLDQAALRAMFETLL
jgi:hypothetical protein